MIGEVTAASCSTEVLSLSRSGVILKILENYYLFLIVGAILGSVEASPALLLTSEREPPLPPESVAT